MAHNGTFRDAGNHVNSGTSASHAMSMSVAAGLGGISQASSGMDNQASIINAAANLKHVEKCREEIKMLNIKSEVMREELNEAQIK